MIRDKATVSIVFCVASALLMANSSAAGDEEWRIYSHQANGDVHYYDTSRVKETGDVRTVWNRVRYKTSVMGAASYQSLLEIDCSERTERILQRTFFSDRDWEKPAMSTDSKKKPKRPIEASSASERLSEVICDP